MEQKKVIGNCIDEMLFRESTGELSHKEAYEAIAELEMELEWEEN